MRVRRQATGATAGVIGGTLQSHYQAPPGQAQRGNDLVSARIGYDLEIDRIVASITGTIATSPANATFTDPQVTITVQLSGVEVARFDWTTADLQQVNTPIPAREYEPAPALYVYSGQQLTVDFLWNQLNIDPPPASFTAFMDFDLHAVVTVYGDQHRMERITQ